MDNGTIPRWRQIVYITTPFFLLLFGLIALNVLTREDEIAVVVPTSTPSHTETAVLQQSVTITPQPTITSEPTTSPPTATPYRPPVYHAEVAVSLLGPPHDTIFRLQDSVVFYWDWPLPLTDDQQFTLYIQHDGQPIPIASLNEPNLGTTYRASLPLTDLLSETAVIQWQIRLESSFADTPLTTSDIRTITVLP